MGILDKKGFEQAMKEYTQEIGWEISELEKDSAMLEFENDQALYIEFRENVLVFSVPSGYVFETEEDIPGELSTELLKRNVEIETGFWAIEESDEGWVYTLYHDQKLPNKDFDLDLDAETFEEIAEAMLEEVEEFDQKLEEETEE